MISVALPAERQADNDPSLKRAAAELERLPEIARA
jgi:hypothetical protein